MNNMIYTIIYIVAVVSLIYSVVVFFFPFSCWEEKNRAIFMLSGIVSFLVFCLCLTILNI